MYTDPITGVIYYEANDGSGTFYAYDPNSPESPWSTLLANQLPLSIRQQIPDFAFSGSFTPADRRAQHQALIDAGVIDNTVPDDPSPPRTASTGDFSNFPFGLVFGDGTRSAYTPAGRQGLIDRDAPEGSNEFGLFRELPYGPLIPPAALPHAWDDVPFWSDALGGTDWWGPPGYDITIPPQQEQQEATTTTTTGQTTSTGLTSFSEHLAELQAAGFDVSTP